MPCRTHLLGAPAKSQRTTSSDTGRDQPHARRSGPGVAAVRRPPRWHPGVRGARRRSRVRARRPVLASGDAPVGWLRGAGGHGCATAGMRLARRSIRLRERPRHSRARGGARRDVRGVGRRWESRDRETAATDVTTQDHAVPPSSARGAFPTLPATRSPDRSVSPAEPATTPRAGWPAPGSAPPRMS
jgi:hypothetical protein